LGRRLELDVESKFASNPRCEGVSIVRGWYEGYDEGDGREFLAAQTREHWELLLDFEPSSDEHHWSLFHFEGFEILKDNVDGEGTPAQIADAVCIVVTQAMRAK
jgi:hypothetical protein